MQVLKCNYKLVQRLNSQITYASVNPIKSLCELNPITFTSVNQKITSVSVNPITCASANPIKCASGQVQVKIHFCWNAHWETLCFKCILANKAQSREYEPWNLIIIHMTSSPLILCTFIALILFFSIRRAYNYNNYSAISFNINQI